MEPSTWDWGFAQESLPQILKALWPTISITLLGAALAVVAGLGLSVLRSSPNGAIRVPAEWFTRLIRGTPSLVLLYAVYYGLASYHVLLSPYKSAVVVLGIYYCGYMSDAFVAAFRSIPGHLIESCAALSLSTSRAWFRVILPLGLRAAVPSVANYLIMAFKETAIFVAIGVPVLLGEAKTIGFTNFRYLEPYTICGLVYILVTIPAIYLVRRLESRNVFG